MKRRSSARARKPRPPSIIEPLTVRVPTAVKLTGISRTKLYQLIRDGEIEIVKLGRSTFVVMESLRFYIDSLRS